MSTGLTPLPWRVGKFTSVIVADSIPADEASAMGDVLQYARDSPDSVRYYGGIIVCESMRTVDVDYAVRAVNEYDVLTKLEQRVRRFLVEPGRLGPITVVELNLLLGELDAVRSGA